MEDDAEGKDLGRDGFRVEEHTYCENALNACRLSQSHYERLKNPDEAANASYCVRRRLRH